MIKIERPAQPRNFVSPDIVLEDEEMYKFYATAEPGREQQRYEFRLKKDIDRNLVRLLLPIFNWKCAYCETKLRANGIVVVDRFRPYNGVREDSEYYKDLYWWLTYKWDNLILSCEECSKLKANYFPIKGERAQSINDPLDRELKMLINPCEDDPSEHFIYRNARIEAVTEEGNQTIELLRLNRPSLMEGRMLAIKDMKEMVEVVRSTSKAHISKEILFLNSLLSKSPEIEFLAAVHAAFLDELHDDDYLTEIFNDDSEIGQFIDYRDWTKDPPQARIVLSDLFSIEYIEIENFKSIDKATLHIPKDHIDENSWVAILGENGTGKSSILQAVCFGLSYVDVFSPEEIQDFIKRGKEYAVIKIKQRDSDNMITTTITTGNARVARTGDFKSKLIGYGSTRLLYNDKLPIDPAADDSVRYKNLFDPLTPLGNIFEWLSQLYFNNRDRFNVIAYAIMQLLPGELDEELMMNGNTLLFKKSGTSFAQFSDGYKSTISLALDIIKTLSEGNIDINKLSGIVVIDELGNQLHPRWQMQVVTQLRKTFPRITFIVSTHHPLCLRGLKANEVVALKQNAGRQTVLIDNLPHQALLRVDQILTSPYFGLYSAIDPEIEKEFDKYYELLNKEELTEDQQREKLRLASVIPKSKYLGDTLRDELALYVIDELLAKEVKGKNIQISIDELKLQAKQRVSEIWKLLDAKNNTDDIH